MPNFQGYIKKRKALKKLHHIGGLVPGNKLVEGAPQDLGTTSPFIYATDEYEDRRLDPWELIAEVTIVVSDCGSVGYRGIK